MLLFILRNLDFLLLNLKTKITERLQISNDEVIIQTSKKKRLKVKRNKLVLSEDKVCQGYHHVEALQCHSPGAAGG